jgi:drug/metabolite transporter (DMT)-like permease
MLFASSLLAVETVVYKYVFNQVSWGTGFFWVMAISGLMGLMSLFIPKIFRETKPELPALKKYYPFILLVATVGFLGNMGFSYAISQVPATVSRSIGAFQPFFVLSYAILFRRFFPQAFREEISFRSISKKLVLFVFITIGVVLTIS